MTFDGMAPARRSGINDAPDILTAGLTPIPRDNWWQESRMVQSLLPLAEWSAQFLPDYIREHMELRPEEAEAEVADA